MAHPLGWADGSVDFDCCPASSDSGFRLASFLFGNYVMLLGGDLSYFQPGFGESEAGLNFTVGWPAKRHRRVVWRVAFF